MVEKPYYLQVGYQGASIALHIIGNVTPETLRYLARFAMFQADTMEERPSAGELEYASWLPQAQRPEWCDRGVSGNCCSASACHFDRTIGVALPDGGQHDGS